MTENQTEHTEIAAEDSTMNQAADETPRTAIRLGKTTYLVGMHFKEDGKETMNDKMIRMIREDVQSGNF